MKKYEIMEIKVKTEEYDKLSKERVQLDITHPVGKCVAQGILSTCMLGIASYAAVALNAGDIVYNIDNMDTMMNIMLAGEAVVGAGLFYDSIGTLFKKAHLNRKCLKILEEIKYIMAKDYRYKYADPVLERWRKFLFGINDMNDSYYSYDFTENSEHKYLGK